MPFFLLSEIVNNSGFRCDISSLKLNATHYCKFDVWARLYMWYLRYFRTVLRALKSENLPRGSLCGYSSTIYDVRSPSADDLLGEPNVIIANSIHVGPQILCTLLDLLICGRHTALPEIKINRVLFCFVLLHYSLLWSEFLLTKCENICCCTFIVTLVQLSSNGWGLMFKWVYCVLSSRL